jgi:hypothetical protein
MTWEMNDRDKVRIQDFFSDSKLNHHLFQKLKPIGNYKFNHLINIQTFTLMCGPKLSLNKRDPTCEIFK